MEKSTSHDFTREYLRRSFRHPRRSPAAEALELLDNHIDFLGTLCKNDSQRAPEMVADANLNPRERFGLIVGGIIGMAIPCFKWMSFLFATGVFGHPGDPASALSDGMVSFSFLLCNLLGFYLPVLFLAAVVIGLRPILGRSPAMSLAGVILILLAISALLMGISLYVPAFPMVEILREGARQFYYWYLPPVALLIGWVSFKPAYYGQFLFSLIAGVLVAIIPWLSIVMGWIEQMPLVIDTFWYLGTGAWLLYLSRNGLEGLPARLWKAAFNVTRTLAALAVLAGWYPAARVLSAYIPALIAQASGRIRNFTIQQDQYVRTYRVYRPVQKSPDPGLVILLHGARVNGHEAELVTRFDRQADRLGWFVAYPDGIGNLWNAYGCCTRTGPDDVKFLSEMISQIKSEYGINSERVYIAGFSLGGMMAYRAACELSEQVVAIAPVAGNMAAADGSVQEVDCRPKRVVSVLAIHGSADQSVPLKGGQGGQTVFAPFDQVAAEWFKIDGCQPPFSRKVDGAVTTTAWTCRDGSRVETRIVNGAGHIWPGSSFVLLPNDPAATLDASRVIADFFADQLPPAEP